MSNTSVKVEKKGPCRRSLRIEVGSETVDGETVVPQQGGFYGGWITSKVVGPFKGEASSLGW